MNSYTFPAGQQHGGREACRTAHCRMAMAATLGWNPDASSRV
jgi:hypothetical protein